MRTRYYRDNTGNPGIKAQIYEASEHAIPSEKIDRDAANVCRRLSQNGHEAYVVGGAVRDLLFGRTPKDFDIATDAPPQRVRKLFRNSRIIGKRFRLVHIYFDAGKILEAATFRAPESGDRNHVYGTIYEDVMRRDFSINALYYNPLDQTVIDFVNGIQDIQKGVLKSVLPLSTSFSEDPVRMLRAVKYAAITGVKIPNALKNRIRTQSHLLESASVSRLSEELYKILKTGSSEIIMRLMDRYHLLESLLPNLEKAVQSSGKKPAVLRESMFLSLAKLDHKVLLGETNRGVMIKHLVEVLMEHTGIFSMKDDDLFPMTVKQVKGLLRPQVHPNRDIENAIRLMFSERGIRVSRSDLERYRKRRTPYRRRKPAEKK